MIRTRSLLALTALAALAACADQATAPQPEAPQAVRTGEGWETPAETRTGYMIGRDGQPFPITFEVREGRAIWEGDIDIGAVEEVPATPEEARRADRPGMRLGVVTSSTQSRWANGRVPYVIDAALPKQSRVTSAISHIENATDLVDFVPRTTERDYVRVIRSTGCSSSVGRVGGVQYVRLADGCSTGNTIHEMLHALGMYHEHTRCDRDSFVRINWNNIQQGYEHNFDLQCSGADDVDAYDEGSIMHYGPTAFSINGLPTIVSLRGLDSRMGQRSGMSTIDTRTVDWMY